MPKEWDTVYNQRTGETHLVPLNDLWSHVPVNLQCACHPERDDEQAKLINHFAFDGRDVVDAIERGEKLI